LSRAQLPETEVTATVVDLLLSRLVTFSLVPIGNWLLEAAGAPPSPDSVTVEPAQTTSPLPALALPALPSPTQPAAFAPLLDQVNHGGWRSAPPSSRPGSPAGRR